MIPILSADQDPTIFRAPDPKFVRKVCAKSEGPPTNEIGIFFSNQKIKIKNCFGPLAPNDHDDDHDEDDGDGNGGGTVSTLTAAALALTKKLSSMLAPKSTDSYHPFHIPLKYWDIYVDDFCGTFQGNKWQ